MAPEEKLAGLIHLFEEKLGKDGGAMALHDLSLAVDAQVPEGVDPRHYAGFHHLIGSTIGSDMEIKGFDWEGESSVLATLTREAQRRGWLA